MHKDQVDRTEELPVYSATVTHVGLPSGVTARLLPRNRRASVMETTLTRVVVVALGAVSSDAGPQHLERVYGWPQWQYPRHSETSMQWKAIFREEFHTWEGMIQMMPDRDGKAVSVGPYATRVTDQMWEMLQSTRTVVLCGGLRGDPTGPQLGAAISGGQLHAVLAEALFE